jgi:hypothetical protein
MKEAGWGWGDISAVSARGILLLLLLLFDESFKA